MPGGTGLARPDLASGEMSVPGPTRAQGLVSATQGQGQSPLRAVYSPAPLARPLWLGVLAGARCRPFPAGLCSPATAVLLAELPGCLCVLRVRRKRDRCEVTGGKKGGCPAWCPLSPSWPLEREVYHPGCKQTQVRSLLVRGQRAKSVQTFPLEPTNPE